MSDAAEISDPKPQSPEPEVLPVLHEDPSRSPVDFVLLIDGDNDPHVPSDVVVTRNTLVRVFLRPGAKMPRTLEKKLGGLPHCTTVVSPRGGANAADFVMSLHAGMLHATLPHHIAFLMVTNDATLSAMAAELQRLGRVATIWTSHPDALKMSQEAGAEAQSEAGAGRSRRRVERRVGRPRARGRRGGRVRSTASSVPSAQTVESAPPPSDEPRKPGGKSLSEVAWAYAARLQRIKDVPSRLKTLLNDIKNRTGSHGFTPEEVLSALKQHHGVKVDAHDHVHVERHVIPPSD